MNNLVVITKIKVIKSFYGKYKDAEERLYKHAEEITVPRIMAEVITPDIIKFNKHMILKRWCEYRPATPREQFLYYTHGVNILNHEE